ncbi:MAG: SDR family NAD(P)-dependent oxidoreductase [Acidobacteriota bacterium]
METRVIDAYRERSVLVTGATGFIGSHLAAALARAGARVTATRTSAARRPRIEIPPAVAWVDLDVRDRGATRDVVSCARPDVVFHLASYGTLTADQDAARMVDVNVAGAFNVWQAAGGRQVRFVMTGTCAEYGPVAGPATEDTPCRPQSAYPASKLAAASLIAGLARETGRPAVILRVYGAFGPGDDDRRVIPSVIAALQAGRTIELTEGRQRRDFCYVDDHVSALLAAGAATTLAPGAIFNIGGGHPTTLREALERVAAVVGGSGRLVFGARPMRPGEAEEMTADITAARRALGYEPGVPFEEGVRRTAAWMRARGRMETA